MPDRDVETIRDLIPRLREDKFLSVRQDCGRGEEITVLDIDSIIHKPRIY